MFACHYTIFNYNHTSLYVVDDEDFRALYNPSTSSSKTSTLTNPPSDDRPTSQHASPLPPVQPHNPLKNNTPSIQQTYSLEHTGAVHNLDLYHQSSRTNPLPTPHISESDVLALSVPSSSFQTEEQTQPLHLSTQPSSRTSSSPRESFHG